MQAMLKMLVPQLTAWVEEVFPAPIDINTGTFNSDPVLYQYLAKHDEKLHCPTVTLGSEKWDVWYVGETSDFRRRHLQHLQQVGTCRQYHLVDLLSGFPSVRDIDMSSPAVSQKVAARQKHFPQDTHNLTACRNSIGWSSVTHVSWVNATDKELRLRAEEAMIAILGPKLNWLRR